MKQKIKVGVIGVGHLGEHHVKHFQNIQDGVLVGIFDKNSSRLKEISNKYNIKFFNSMNELIENVDAVSIVATTSEHKKIAEVCIKNNKHVFIEKPIATTVDEANFIIKLAKQRNVIVQVGHIERLNPALLALDGYDISPNYIEIQRLAPYTSRGTDVPVVLDLMIHDIDLVLAFVNSPVKNIDASGVSIMTSSVDIANARLTFENGSVANITSSRIAKDRVRKIKLFQKDLYVTIDFLISLTEVYKVMDGDQNDPKALMSASLKSKGKARQIFYEKPKIEIKDALKLELENFIKSVKGEEAPIVDGIAAKNALEIALQIQDKIMGAFK